MTTKNGGGRPAKRLLQSKRSMPIATENAKLSVEDLAARFRGELIPLSNRFSYFSTAPIAEEDLKQYLHDPIAAISPAISELIPPVGIVLVPYLERANGKHGDMVNFEKPVEARSLAAARAGNAELAFIVLAIKDIDIADYHYTLYNVIATLTAEHWPAEARERFTRLLREELSSEVHGEVDEGSWHLKQALLRRQSNVRNETKLFKDYARQAFQDTLTLYLHGTCCDIDVDTGPRQMPSRYLRKRLELLMSLYPPPDGYAVFPEQLKKR
jgi:hypothetical protein